MQNFIFENTTKIIFGKGQIEKTGCEVAKFGKKVLMVYGEGSVKKSGVFDQVRSSLQDADIEIVEFPGARANPVLSHVLKGVEIARESEVDVILAVGGGSVMDTAKAIAVGAKTDYDLWDYFRRERTVEDALPVMTVVTLSASASEMNPAAVVTNEEEAQKFSIRSPFIQPRTSILDPTALFTLSPSYSAYSAVDAITHMLEGYFNNTEPESALQDRLVEALMKTIMESTEAILKDPVDYDARAKMMWSAVLAFNGLTTAGMGTVSFPAHMIEHSLSALYDIAHGAGLSIVMPAWMSYALADNPPRFARLARKIFDVEDGDDLEAGEKGIKRLQGWFASIGCPVSLEDAGIPESDIGRIAANARELARVWGLESYREEVIAAILRLCI